MSEISPGNQPKRYTPEMTQQVKQAAISNALTAQVDALRKNPERTNLSNYEKCVAIADQYMTACAGIGVLPSVEGLCANLGCSRQWFYRYIERNPDSKTAQYFDRLRLSWAAMRMALVERGILEPGGALFILKNSKLGMSDRPEENDVYLQSEEGRRPSWAFSMTDEEYANRLIEALPDPDDDARTRLTRYLSEYNKEGDGAE